jgi:hypothetical protein
VAARPVDVAWPETPRARIGSSSARRSDRLAAHGRTRRRVAVRGGGDCGRRRTARGRLPHRGGTGRRGAPPVRSPISRSSRGPSTSFGPGSGAWSSAISITTSCASSSPAWIRPRA